MWEKDREKEKENEREGKRDIERQAELKGEGESSRLSYWKCFMEEKLIAGFLNSVQ